MSICGAFLFHDPSPAGFWPLPSSPIRGHAGVSEAGACCDEDHSALDGLLLCWECTVIVPGGAMSTPPNLGPLTGRGPLSFTGHKSRLRATAEALCSPGRAGGWIETPHCQFDNHRRCREARPWGRRQSRRLAPDGFAVFASGAALGPRRLSGTQKAPKRDADHGCPCPVLSISTQPKKGTAMTTAVILVLALATGMALTTAFAFSLLPLVLM